MTSPEPIPGARRGRLETDVSRAIQDALESVGCWSIRVQSGQWRYRGHYIHGAEPGTPDLWTPRVWLEVKRDGKQRPRASQELWHARAEREGVRVMVVSSIQEALAAVRSGI